jgi:Gas vesicle protein
MGTELQLGRNHSSGLVDVLDRVLDKGLVIAGDIKVSLAEVELLTIRIRLIVCSIDKAQEIGLDWWKYDHHLAPGRNRDQAENQALREQVRLLERKLETLTRPASARRSTARR